MILFIIYSELFSWGGARGGEVIILLGVYRISDGGLEIKLWIYQKKGIWDRFFIYSVLRLIPVSFACILGAIFGFDFNLYLLACAILSVIVLFSSLRVDHELSKLFCLSVPKIFTWVYELLPVGVAAGVESLAVNLPRFYLASIGEIGALGAFLVFAQISNVFGIVASAKLQSDIPLVSQVFSNGNKNNINNIIVRALVIMAVFNLFIGLLFYLLPTTVFGKVFGDWVLKDFWVFLWVPAFSWVWYSGGYVANVLAIIDGKKWLLRMAFFLLSVVLVFGGADFLAPGVFGRNYLVLAIFTLGVAFLFRLILVQIFVNWKINAA